MEKQTYHYTVICTDDKSYISKLVYTNGTRDLTDDFWLTIYGNNGELIRFAKHTVVRVDRRINAPERGGACDPYLGQ